MSKYMHIKSVAVLLAGLTLTACTTVSSDPSIATAPPTLKGCEFGPPNELLADLELGQSYLSKSAASAIEIKLQDQMSDIVQRLASMEEVRKKTNYVANIKRAGDINQAALDEANENRADLQRLRDRQGMLALEARQYNAMSGPDVIISKDSRGSYQETNTYKGMQRDSVIANQNSGASANEGLSAAYASQHQDKLLKIAKEQQQFLAGNPNFAQVKAYISSESDVISEQLWPALKITLSEVAQGNKK